MVMTHGSQRRILMIKFKSEYFDTNKNRSIDNKLDYYFQTYDDNLVHKHNEAIRIVNAFAIDFYMGGDWFE